MKFPFRGSLVALATPFTQKGRLDRKALERLVTWHIEEGTDGIVCAASTGEGVSLTDDERKEVAVICLDTAQKKIPVIVSTGAADTKRSVQSTEQMFRLGAQGCLVVTPYYNKPSPRGCLLHFQEIAKVGLPVICYHNPSRTGLRLSVETVAEIGKIPGIAALKESSHDLEFLKRLHKLSPLPLLSGEDDLTLEAIREGAIGSISVTGNLIPRAWKQMIGFALSKKWEKAAALFEKYLPLCRALFRETNPQGVKFALAYMGKCLGILRLPLVEVEPQTQEEIQQALLALHLPLFPISKTVSS